MNEFMKILLSLSISGTLLLLLILGLKRLYQNRFSRRWQYYIWIIVAMRFLLPFTPDTTIVGSMFEKFDTEIITIENAADSDRVVVINTGNYESVQAQKDKNVNTTAVSHGPLSIYDGLFLVWAVFALVLFVRKITFYQSFTQYIKAGNTEVSDIKTLNLLSDCEEKLNIKTRVELYHNVLITSPMMIGFFRPGIVLPVREFKEKELSCIFMHELIHCRQKDMFYKWLIQMVVCIHWFNPFAGLLEKEVNKACELSCDEKVISLLGDKARSQYGDTLISFLRSNNLYKGSLASVTLTEGAEQLKERLGAIMNFREKTKLITIVSFLAALLLSAGGFAIGAYAARPTLPENKADLTVPAAAEEIIHTIKEIDTMKEEISKLELENVRMKEEINKLELERVRMSKLNSIIFESKDIFSYEDGSPDINALLPNDTGRRIIKTEYCMIDYDEKGSLLRLRCNYPYSSAESNDENYQGGWPDRIPKTVNGEAAEVVHSLFHLKQIVYEDGTVWNNPDYEDWFRIHAVKEIDTDELQCCCSYSFYRRIITGSEELSQLSAAEM